MYSSWRIVLHRALSDRLLLFAAAVTILLSVTVLAASPIYADAVTLASLQRILEEGDADSSIAVTAAQPPSDFDDLDAIVRGEAGNSFAGGRIFARATGTSAELDVESEDDLFPLVSVQYIEEIESHATLAAGSWPEPGPPPYEVVLLSQTAVALGVGPGDELLLTNRRSGAETPVLVVGVADVDDPSDPFWHGDEMFAAGVVETQTFRTYGPFMVSMETLLGPMSHLQTEMSWRVIPDHASMAVDAIPTQLQAVLMLEARLNAAVGERASVFEVATGLDEILAEAEQSVVATRSGVLMLALQLAILAGYALMHTAGLLVDSRMVETGLLRARGAGNGQVLAVAGMEGVILTLPAIILGPPLATLLLRFLNSVGPLATIGLQFEPRVNATAYVIALVAALFCIVVLSVPAYRASRTFNDSLIARSRQETRSLSQRAGWDIALIVLAGIGFWQLATNGVQLSASLRDRWGIDPLLVAVPALGMLGGAVLALRFVPLVASILERVTARGRTTVPALSSWQIARRPRRYARAALLLIIAMSVGFFVSAYTNTWTQSQRDQAAFLVGPSIRFTPVRSAVALSDLHLRAAQEALPGVEAATPVVFASGQLIRGGPVTRYFAIDASVASRTMVLGSDVLGANFPGLMDELVEGRPELATVPVPGEPGWIHAVISVTSEEPCGRAFDLWEANGNQIGERYLYSTNCLKPVVSVVLRDRFGLFHRIELGEAVVNEGANRLSADLRGGADHSAAYPLEVVGIEIRTGMPGERSWEQEAAVELSLEVSDSENGPTQPVSFPDTLAGAYYAPGTIQFGTSVTPFATASGNDGIIVATLGTGVARSQISGLPIHWGIRPSGSEGVPVMPMVVTAGLLERTGTNPDVRLELTRFNTLSGIGGIIGTIELFPTIDVGVQEAVLLDLPTLQAASYRPGAPIDRPTEYWMGVETAAIDDVAAALAEAPFGATQVRTVADQTAVLVSDPMALSVIAALSMGFVAALVFAIIGFTVNIIVLARERQTEFTLLRALGLSIRQLRSWLGLEQAAVVLSGLALGTFIGAVLSWMILPLISVTQAGVVPVPAPKVLIPAVVIVGLNIAIFVVLAIVVSALAYMSRRRNIASQLRMGD